MARNKQIDLFNKKSLRQPLVKRDWSNYKPEIWTDEEAKAWVESLNTENIAEQKEAYVEMLKRGKEDRERLAEYHGVQKKEITIEVGDDGLPF